MSVQDKTSPLSVELRDVVHIYEADGSTITALDHVSVVVEPGEMLSIIGPSGSGKSTILSLLAGIVRPTSGTLHIGEHDITQLSERQLLPIRARELGFIAQGPARTLLPYESALNNIAFARLAAGRRPAAVKPEILLERVGLLALAKQPAARMSGGEQQRLAVAVALTNAPALLLADEPTSQLDDFHRDSVMDALHFANTELGMTVVVVTHDDAVAEASSRRLEIRDGKIVDDRRMRW